MTITTKYNIGQEVWILLLDTPEEFIITGIKYVNHKIFVGCYYYIKSTDCEYEVELPEELLFQTKEELLKHYNYENN